MKFFTIKKILNKRFCLVGMIMLFLAVSIHPVSLYGQQSVDNQSKKYSYSATNKSVKDVFAELTKLTGLYFIYSESTISNIKNISLDLKSATTAQILKILSQKAGLVMKQDNNTVAVTKLKSSSSASKSSANNEVTGVVVDGNGLPVIGASVLISGSMNGTITDVSGKFTLKVPSNGSIKVTYLGYEDAVVSVAGKDNLHIVLKEAAQLVDEVVVVGYGTQKKVNLTGSIEVIGGDKLKDRPAANITQALQGQVSGAAFSAGSNGFEPGASMSFQIRGQGNAYVLVDGVESSLDRVNPNDIESISVLKDAAASAIYGAKASYGVVLVTTKSGKNNKKPTVSFSSNVSISKISRLPETLDSYTYAKAINEASFNGGATSLTYTPEVIDRIIAYQAGDIDYETVAVGGNSYAQLTSANGNNFWFDDYYGNAVNNQETISITGGSDKVSYYVSAGHTFNDSPLQYGTDVYRRINTTAKVNLKLADWWDFSINNRFAKTNRTTPNMDEQGSYSLIFHQIARTMPNEAKYTPNGNVTYRCQIPLLTDGGNDITEIYETVQNFATEIRPAKGLKFNANYTVMFTNNRFTSNNIPVYDEMADGTFEPSSLTIPSYVNKNTTTSVMTNLNLFATYEQSINDKHNFTLMAGMQQEGNKMEYMQGRKDDLITGNVPSFSTTTGIIQSLTDKLTHSATLGAFMRFNYNYKEKYLIEFNGRYDGTSVFADGNRWGFFPSMSAGWVVSKEKFFEGISDKINNFKVRASWGNLGNQNVAAYQDLSLLGINTNLNWIMGGVRPAYTTSAALINPFLTWEKSQTTDIGVDLAFANNRLSVTADWYRRNTYDRLGPSEARPSVLGKVVPKSNNSELQTNGWEVAVSWRDRIGDDFSYNVSAMVWDYYSEITKYNNPTNILTTDYEGKRVGEIWGYESNGLIQTDQDAAYITDNKVQSQFYNSTWNRGDVKYEDLNGDGVVNNGSNTLDDHGDLKVIGNSAARFQYNLTLGAQYKNFDFNLILQGVGKRDIIFGNNDNLFWGFRTWNQSSVFDSHLDYYRDSEADKQKGLGENLNSYFPRPYVEPAMNNKNRQISSLYMQNGAYLRVKNIQVGYTLPEKASSKLSLQLVRFYFSADNLMTLTGNFPEHMDPDNATLGAFGLGKSMNAQVNYSFGVNVQF